MQAAQVGNGIPLLAVVFVLVNGGCCFQDDHAVLLCSACVYRASVGSDRPGSDGGGSGSAERRAGDAEAAVR